MASDPAVEDDGQQGTEVSQQPEDSNETSGSAANAAAPAATTITVSHIQGPDRMGSIRAECTSNCK
jgi:hypothetical protein